MPIRDEKPKNFSWYNIDKSPAKHGVYGLFRGSELIYYGRAIGKDVTIRSRLTDHMNGDYGPCTQNATAYKREVTEAAISRERELLEIFERAYGRPPACNKRAG